MKYILLVIVLLVPSNLYAQTVGCVNGRLTDPKAWFFDHIHRSVGQNANDWYNVLSNSGILGGPPPGQKAGPSNYGITQQIDSGGTYRSRLFLPTDTQDALGYYTHPVDTVAGNPGSQTWTWNDLGGPAYSPRPCDGIIVDPPTPGDDHTEINRRLSVLEAQVNYLQDENRANKVAITNLDVKVNAIDDLVKVLYARPFYTTCSVQLGLRCRLIQ